MILQHPNAPVKMDPPTSDPRHQDVITRIGACKTCGKPNRLHVGVTGTWLGCEIAAYSARRIDRPVNPERWNDPWPAVTAAVRSAMVDGTCGPQLEIEMAGHTNDEQLTIAHTLARVVIAAYIKELAK